MRVALVDPADLFRQRRNGKCFVIDARQVEQRIGDVAMDLPDSIFGGGL